MDLSKIDDSLFINFLTLVLKRARLIYNFINFYFLFYEVLRIHEYDTNKNVRKKLILDES